MGNAIATLLAVGALLFFAQRAEASGTSRAKRLIQTTETLSLEPYMDEGGTWHVGWGHKLPRKPDYNRISRFKAEQLLDQDLAIASNAVDRLVKVPINANQRAALISFVYNLGASALAGSTLLRKLNNKNYTGAAKEFERWVHVGGEPSKGLRTRRHAEKQVFSQ